VILLVNKPDFFEPGELTYIGFDNDFSEMPMIESDKIDFGVNYNDTTKKFLDGNPFNGDICGAKKILKFAKYSGSPPTYRNGYYEADYGNYRLTFPKKGLIKLVVAASNTAWKFYPNALNPSGSTSLSNWGHCSAVR
jgi:hypothetical protein